MTIPRMSVLMPAYNCGVYVSEAIESIIHQSFADWELLIADDFSTDNTRSLIDKHTDSRIRKIHNEAHLGVVGTRNKLITYARGEYIVWQDADDSCAEDRLMKLLNAFEADPELVVCGSNCIQISYWGRRHITHHPLTHNDIRSAVLQQSFPFTGASVAVKRSAITENLQFRERFSAGGEDPDWLLRLTEIYKAANIEDELYIYRYTRNSLSKSAAVVDVVKLNAMRIVFFLAQQRYVHGGVDGLMEEGDRAGLDEFISALEHEYEKDKTVVYRKACYLKTVNQDYLYALYEAFLAISKRPYLIENYLLLCKITRSFLKSCLTLIKLK